jgi:hypothetical protein
MIILVFAETDFKKKTSKIDIFEVFFAQLFYKTVLLLISNLNSNTEILINMLTTIDSKVCTCNKT